MRNLSVYCRVHKPGHWFVYLCSEPDKQNPYTLFLSESSNLVLNSTYILQVVCFLQVLRPLF